MILRRNLSASTLILLCHLRITAEASPYVLHRRASFVSAFHRNGAQDCIVHSNRARCSIRRCFRLVLPLYLSRAPPSTSSTNCDHLQITTQVTPARLDANGDIQNDEEQIQQILTGRHKWLGGAVDNAGDGSVYGIPSHSQHVICLSPPQNNHDSSNNSTYQVHMLPLPTSLSGKSDNGKKNQFKWLRGIIVGETLFGIPSWSTSGVLKVDIGAWRRWRENNPTKRIVTDVRCSQQFVSVLPLPEEGSEKSDKQATTTSRRWMWHGAALNQNATAIYCIPSNAKQVLKVDLTTMTTSYISIPPSTLCNPKEHANLLEHTNKWYGGILGRDNAIYGIPYAASSVLRINANDDTASLLGDYGSNMYNWHGGVLAKNGAIYAFPAHAEEVLKIDTMPNIEEQNRLMLLPIQRAEYDVDGVRRYKWLGGSLGADGNVYGMPSDATSVLRINIENDEVNTFGYVKSSCDNGETGGGYLEKNKWQGGVLGKDGFVYAVPSNARGVLRIDTRATTPNHSLDPSRVACIGDLPEMKDKWQGGFLVRRGAIYGIPENSNRILELLPPFCDDGEHGGEVVVQML
ncbi:hypothetical protein HJC23_003067 [Cyclotella cryptica]|uniref:Uncharacterized protein n=1 Tax=Cyclotella cryptica TaxID=29204 RepID=A0ABD3PY23_9STRA